MGAWGPGLFDDDTACDIRDSYRERIEDGVDDTEALRATLELFRGCFDSAEVGALSIVALAVTQSKIGRLDAEIRARALAALEAGADLAWWEEDDPKLAPRRRAALAKARAQITGPQPARKRLRPPRRELCGLVAGDGLTLVVADGLALLRVVRVKNHRLGETPILEELQFEGSELPPRAELDQTPAKPKSIALGSNPRFSGSRGCKFYRGTWEQAGFRKAAKFAPRAGDEDAECSSYIAWMAIAKLLRGEIR
jgi:hypothetical protein